MEKRAVVEVRRSFGRRVREARGAVGLSQARLARALGLRSGVAVGDWERGKALPKFETFLRLCEVLNQAPAYFIEGYRERPRKDPAERMSEALEGLDTHAAQRHLEVLHRLEHLPVEVGRGITPEELRATLDRMRTEDGVAEGRLQAALRPGRSGSAGDAEHAAAREAFRLGWDAARETLRDWLQQRARIV